MFSVPFIDFIFHTIVWMFRLTLGAWKVIPTVWHFIVGGVHAASGVLNPKDFAHAILFGLGVAVTVLQVLSAVSNDFGTVAAALAGGLATVVLTIQKWLGPQTAPTPPKITP